MCGIGPHDVSVNELLTSARECLIRERRRTLDELAAFETFERRLRSIRPDTVSVTRGRSSVAAVSTASAEVLSGLDAVREAYETTVMDVSHYTEEYGDTYVQSIVDEFGSDIGAALIRGLVFDERCKRAVMDAVSTSQETREALLGGLNTERASLDEATDELCPLVDEIRRLSRMRFRDESFGALDAYRARLGVMQSRCDALTARRQKTLRRQRRELRLSIGGLNLPSYLYQDLSVDFPVCSAIAELGGWIESVRTNVERAMGHCS